MINIEQNLREICKRKGLKLSDIAERIGTGQSNLITSLKGNPTISKLEDVAAALQVSVAELLTMRPEAAAGIVIIDGQTYSLTKPTASTVQLPSFAHYDTLRKEIKDFIKKSVNGVESVSKMGIVDTLEAFSLVYDAKTCRFLLSLCYSNGLTLTSTYDKLEFCNWNKSSSKGDAAWDIKAVSDEICNDIEGRVPMIFQAGSNSQTKELL